jgi:hypothetical protein
VYLQRIEPPPPPRKSSIVEPISLVSVLTELCLGLFNVGLYVAASRVRFGSCGICGVQSGTGAGFSLAILS